VHADFGLSLWPVCCFSTPSGKSVEKINKTNAKVSGRQNDGEGELL